MFHPCFQCFSTLKPAMFRLLNINDSSIKHREILNETKMNHRWRNSYVYMFYDWIPSTKIISSSDTIISNQFEQNHLLEIWIERQKYKNLNFNQKIDCPQKINDLQCFLNTRKLASENWPKVYFSAGKITCGCRKNILQVTIACSFCRQLAENHQRPKVI